MNKKLNSKTKNYRSPTIQTITIIMGIKNLNQYLISSQSSTNSLRKRNMDVLSGEVVAVDISIYIYKFLGEGNLLTQMYLFLGMFYFYKIHPIFVFDGKPPPEKYELLKRRKCEKQNAKMKLEEIQAAIEVGEVVPDNATILQMEMLRKKMVSMHHTHVQLVKRLIASYGFPIVEAPHEADEMCAKLCLAGIATMCMSDDTDMFLYGCPFVLRNISLLNHTVVVYDTAKILENMQLELSEFREIMVLSGTDYSVHKKQISISKIIAWYREYKSELEKSETNTNTKTKLFYEWLNNKGLLDDIELPTKCCSMFVVDCEDVKGDRQKYDVSDLNFEVLKEIMEPDGFIFL